ncbi:hypothetical protein R3P38DRAFT_2925310 [Favolaschia claudopus]|uniref:Protein kinase domain-containing protein n=1 Tax=Favolaschia claudopus TaxID=2862362 RepID=A0AAW0BXW4_9AGAR
MRYSVSGNWLRFATSRTKSRSVGKNLGRFSGTPSKTTSCHRSDVPPSSCPRSIDSAHDDTQPAQWPNFPGTYGELFEFSMPELAADTTTTTTTACWSGADPPLYPLCYSYRDQTIIPRALGGLENFIEIRKWWTRPTPAEAAELWEGLEVQYQTVEYEKEQWLSPVLTILRMIVTALMRDLGLAYSISEVVPRRQHQVGDIDWAVFLRRVPTGELTSVLLKQLESPSEVPAIRSGCAIEAKATAVLERYHHFFKQPLQLFPPPGPHLRGRAILFKLDLQMCHRVMNNVSCSSPRFGLIYSGHQCLVVENMNPTVPAPPFIVGSHARALAASAALLPGTDPCIRGIGQSDLQPLVPSALKNEGAMQRPPFLALLVAICAPPGTLTFGPPDPSLSALGHAAYSGAIPSSPISSQSASPGIDRAGHTPASLQIFLSLQSLIHSGKQATVHRGMLAHETPVVVKMYDSCDFDALLREADAYEQLELSGVSATPKCLGIFAPVHKRWAALVLEDGGLTIGKCWRDVSLEDRMAVYATALQVHASGIIHGDLECRNFTRDTDGHIRVIDFGHSTVGHVCDNACSELLDLRHDLSLDDPAH